MTVITEESLNSNDLRLSLYNGSVHLQNENRASLKLVDGVKNLLVDRFGEDYRNAQHNEDKDAFFGKISLIRKELYLDKSFHQLTRDVLEESGWDLESCAFDPVRLRVVPHKGHENPRAKSVYYAHRDTWYSHSQSLITWWIPLDDLREEETFVFYPQYFKEEVANDSEIFDYDRWTQKNWDLKIGWQNKNDGLTAKYPSLTGSFDEKSTTGFACRKAQNLLFSGAQFHQTLKQETGQTRFSLDFRVVHKGDHAKGLGAPNVDNRSTGCSLKDYINGQKEV